MTASGEESLEIESDQEHQATAPEKSQSQPLHHAKKLTSRQRALYAGQEPALPKEEELQPASAAAASKEASPTKRLEELKKRRILRQEKLELTKQATVDKLLKGSSSAAASGGGGGKRQKNSQSQPSQSSGEPNLHLPKNGLRFVHNCSFNGFVCGKEFEFPAGWKAPTAQHRSVEKCHSCKKNARTCWCVTGKGTFPICSQLSCYLHLRK